YNSQELLEIDLDPSLSPIENAQKYFKKYKKLKKGISILKEQKEKLENELYYLNSLEFAIENAKTLADLKEIEEELEKEGYLKEAKEQIIKREKKSEPYKFVSSDGFEIYVGKNNKQNETLTFQIAKTEDLWLHARGIPGAHVIIKTQGKEIPENTLYEASSLAAYFSKGRNSSYVPVDYTKKKYVQKPKGGKPGFVIYKNEKTIFAKPEDALKFLSQNT
ncbi:MAG: NFACT RNA binding domain-containing protein, partial [Dictyoglomus sp.]